MAEQRDRAVFVISVAAELAGVHPQTLRIYEREGLVRPKRTTANARRYSERDIERLLRDQAADQRRHEPGRGAAGHPAHPGAGAPPGHGWPPSRPSCGPRPAATARSWRAVRRSARRDLVPYSSAIVRYEHPTRYEQA